MYRTDVRLQPSGPVGAKEEIFFLFNCPHKGITEKPKKKALGRPTATLRDLPSPALLASVPLEQLNKQKRGGGLTREEKKKEEA